MDARRLRFGLLLALALGVVGLSLALGLSGGGGQADGNAAVITKGQEVGPGTWRLVRGSSSLVFTVPAGLRVRYRSATVAICHQGPCNPSLLFMVTSHDVLICMDAVTGRDCGGRAVRQEDGTMEWRDSGAVPPAVEALIGDFFASVRVEDAS